MHRRLQSRQQMEMQTFFEADRCPLTSYDDVMANPAQLAGQIRYHLGELSTRSGHHEFEELARHTARARLYSNILPATGPVSSGGDGGRDFETFETQISDRLSVGSSFAGRSSTTRRVAFACSLEKKIEAKIRRDLKTIIENGKPDEIIYFCEGNLPIGRRRKLIKEAEAADVELRVFDGTAIAEWLAEPTYSGSHNSIFTFPRTSRRTWRRRRAISRTGENGLSATLSKIFLLRYWPT